MGSGVDDSVSREAMRQIDMSAGVAERELQYRHAGNLVPLPQGSYVRCNDAQIFRKKGQAAQSLAQLVEQLIAGPIHPTPMDRRSLVRRNLPELRETAKMIQPDEIAGLGRPAQPLNPPLVTLRPHRIPVVERISPTLPGCAERVGRNAGDDLWLQISIQPKQIGVSPHIGTVVIDKNGDIAYHPDGTLGTVESQGVPLLVEEELNGPADLQSFGEFMPCGIERLRFAAGQLARPLAPNLLLVTLPKRVVEDEVLQPPGILFAKTIKARSSISRSAAEESFCGFSKQWQLHRANLTVVDISNAVGQRRETRRLDPPALRQPVQADEQRIPGKSRSRRVRRISVRGRSQRKHLPKSLAR